MADRHLERLSASGLVHEAAIYSSDEELLTLVLPFLRVGLAAGESVVVVETAWKAALLRDALGADAAEVHFVNADLLYRSPAHAIVEYRRALDAFLPTGEEPVRLLGEVQFGLTRGQHEGWTRYEAAFNRIFAGARMLMLCPYDRRVLPDYVIADAARTHRLITDDSGRRESERYLDPDELVPVAVPLEGAIVGEALATVRVHAEPDLPELRRTVASSARAAGLAPGVPDDVTLAVDELARGALARLADTTVQIARDGARWLCQVTESGAQEPRRHDADTGIWIARLIGDRVEVSGGDADSSLRLTLTPTGADARRRILDAASELFYQNGIRATGVNAIIAHSGVAKATLYNQFATKGALVRAWLDEPATRWFERIRLEAEARAEPPAERLLVLFDVLREWFERDDFRGSALLNAAAEVPNRADPVREATNAYALEIQQYLRQTASDAGLPHPDRLAPQLHVLLEGAIVTAVATRSAEPAATAKAAARLLIGASGGAS